MTQTNPHFKCNNTCGFTLLELLIALSIMTLLITLTFSGFQVGSRAWEKGEALVTRQQYLRVVPELIRRQLSALVASQDTKTGVQSVGLQGTSTTLFFFSTHSLYPETEPGIVLVRYTITNDDENNTQTMSFSEFPIMGTEEIDFNKIESATVLLSNFHRIYFSFQIVPDAVTGKVEEVPVWDPEEMEGTPVAIRISIQKVESDLPINILIPIFIDE